MNKSEAYRRVYKVSPGTKAETVHRKAFELTKNGKVAARVEELKGEREQKKQWSREELIEFIRETAMDIARNGQRDQDRAAAIRLLGEMEIADAFAAKRTDATVRKVEEPGTAALRLRQALQRVLARDNAIDVDALPALPRGEGKGKSDSDAS